jgi:hypothetical protein
VATIIPDNNIPIRVPGAFERSNRSDVRIPGEGERDSGIKPNGIPG